MAAFLENSYSLVGTPGSGSGDMGKLTENNRCIRTMLPTYHHRMS